MQWNQDGIEDARTHENKRYPYFSRYTKSNLGICLAKLVNKIDSSWLSS